MERGTPRQEGISAETWETRRATVGACEGEEVPARPGERDRSPPIANPFAGESTAGGKA